MFTNLLKNFDIFGIIVNLNYEGRREYKSILGGIFALIISFLTLIFTILLGQDMYLRQNPTTIYSKIPQDKGGLINLTNNFPFMMKINMGPGIPIKNVEKYFNFPAYIRNIEITGGEQKLDIKSLQFQQCDYEKDLGKDYDMFKSSIESTIMNYCLKPDQNIVINGNIGSSKFSFIEIFFQRCKNETEVICKPKEEIDLMFSKVIMNVYFKDNIFKSDDYTNPIREYVYNYNTALSSKVSRRIFIYLKNIDFVTDDGLVFSDIKTESRYQLANSKETYTFEEAAKINPDTLSQITIATDNIKDVYFRKYKKIQNVAAEVGGIINVFVLSANIIIQFLAKSVIKNEIFDKIFVFNDSQLDQNVNINFNVKLKKVD
jgi:hypothetical protein